MNIYLDAMGGDNAPDAIVNGCVDAIKCEEGFNVTLFGDEQAIKRILQDRKYAQDRLDIVHCSEVITSDDVPTQAIRNKKDSSMVKALSMQKTYNADAVISAGNSGALLTGSLLITGRIDGVLRPALGALIPKVNDDYTLLIDAGFNSNLRAESYLQFAKFGSEYMKIMMNMDNPRIGLLNIGTEETKGSPEAKEAYALLKQSDLNFLGNIESNSIAYADIDVLVTDGFTGNVCLKTIEGTSSFIFGSMKNMFKTDILHKFAAFIVRSDLAKFKKTLDPDIMGGAPVLGVNGLIIKSHGNSNVKTMKNVVLKTVSLAKNDIVGKIKNAVSITTG